ncbi:HipA family kinase [Limnohabitans sp. Rim8]|uniref:HipA family kinase n=1 Tax=Limnohabitans sp. Rim8 TaxID=1100718 RepID=UPI00351AA72A
MLTMVQSVVIIEEIRDRSPHGKTEPFICRGDDGEIYYVRLSAKSFLVPRVGPTAGAIYQ